MGLFEQFPYTNFHELNLDWLLYMVKNLSNQMDTFVSVNTIKFADPLSWDISKQYEKNTLVQTENGLTFLSKKPVPSGISVDNADFWLKVADFGESADIIRENIGGDNEGNRTTATATRNIGDLVWLSGFLYKITAPMIPGDTYVSGSNCENVTVAELIDEIKNEIVERAKNNNEFANVLDYGADKSGETLSTNSFNEAKSTGKILFVPPGKYNIDGFTLTGNSMFVSAGAEFENPPVNISLTNSGACWYFSPDGSPVSSYFEIQRWDNDNSEAPSIGFVKSTFMTDTVVDNDNDYFNWGILSVLRNYTHSDQSENVAVYGQASDHYDSKTWASCFEMVDYNRAPQAGKLGQEINMTGSGPDPHTQRIGVDISIHNLRKEQPGHEPNVIGAGFRIGSAANDGDNRVERAFSVIDVRANHILIAENVDVSSNAIDLSECNINGNALALRQGQKIKFGRFQMYEDDSAHLIFTIDGTTVGYIAPDGFHDGEP